MILAGHKTCQFIQTSAYTARFIAKCVLSPGLGLEAASKSWRSFAGSNDSDTSRGRLDYWNWTVEIHQVGLVGRRVSWKSKFLLLSCQYRIIYIYIYIYIYI